MPSLRSIGRRTKPRRVSRFVELPAFENASEIEFSILMET